MTYKTTISIDDLKNNLDNGNCLVIFDGLDEVPKGQRENIRRWTDSVMKEYQNTQFILTSRPHGFELNADQPSYPIKIDLKLRIREFTNDQKEQFINKWYRTVMWEMKWKKLYENSLNNPHIFFYMFEIANLFFYRNLKIYKVACLHQRLKF